MRTRPLSLLDLTVFLFVLTALPALMMGYNWNLGIDTLICLFLGLLIYWTTSRFTVKMPHWDVVAMILIGIGGVVSLYFISQAGRLDYAEKVSFISTIAGIITRFTPDLSILKPHTNSIAVFLEGIFFVSIGVSLAMKSGRFRWFWYSLTGLVGFAILMTASRGSWLAILVAGLLWMTMHWRYARWFLFVGVGAGVVLVLYVLARGSLESINEIPVLSSFLGSLFFRPDRVEVYRNSLALIEEYPFTGIGLGNQFGMVYSHYQLLLPYLYLTYSHNLYLEVWLQQGLAGAAVWISLITTIGLYSPILFHKPRCLRSEATWIGLFAILLHGITDARMYEDLWCWLPFFVLLGLLEGARPKMGEPSLRKWGWMPLVSVGLFLLTAGLVFSPLTATWFTNLGSLYQQRSDLTPNITAAEKKILHERATTYFARSIEMKPDQRPANYRLGLIDLEDLEIDQALTFLERSFKVSPDHLGTQKALGMVYTLTGKIDQAEPLLKDKLQIIDELNYWGWNFKQQGRDDYSLNAYLLSLQLNPNQPDLSNYLKQIKGNQ
jgi:O-antigen ligase